MTDPADYRSPKQAAHEDELVDVIAAIAGIDRSRLKVFPILLDPSEWHIDRRLRLDGRKVKIRWWQPSLLTSHKEIEQYARDIKTEIEWRASE